MGTTVFLFSRAKMDGQMTSDPAAPTSVDNAEPRSGRSDDDTEHLRILGLAPGASWDEICRAHERLVADLTPGPEASHRNVALARNLLNEVNSAFASLRLSSVA